MLWTIIGCMHLHFATPCCVVFGKEKVGVCFDDLKEVDAWDVNRLEVCAYLYDLNQFNWYRKVGVYFEDLKEITAWNSFDDRKEETVCSWLTCSWLIQTQETKQG